MSKREKTGGKRKHYGRGKVFYRLLFSYLGILLIPLSMSLIVFRQSHNSMAREAERANGLLLNQLKEFCDKSVQDALSITNLVSFNARIEGLIYEKGPVDSDIRYKAYSASEDFEDYLFANHNILSFYAYIPRLDLVISPFGFYSTRSFYNNVLGTLDYSYTEWLSYFHELKGRRFAPFQTRTQSEQLVDTMALFSPLPVTDNNSFPRGITAVEMDMSLFRDLMRDTVWTERSVLAIYDREEGILLSTDEELDYEAILMEKELSSLPTGYKENLTLNGVDYVALVSQSDVVSWSYISLIPSDIYNDQFNRMVKLTVIFMMAAALLGGILVYFTTRNRYKPIHDILAMFQSEGEGDITLSNDEYNMITRSIRMTMDEDSRLKEEVRVSLPVLQQRELRLLLKGEIDDDQGENEKLEKLGLRFEKSYFLLVLLDIELEEDVNPGIRDECIDMLRKIDDETDYLILIKDLDGHVAYLISRNQPQYYEILEGMAAVRDRVEEVYPASVAMGLSSLHTRQDGFPVLYKEARKALEFRLVKGRSRPLLFEDVNKSTHAYYYPMEQETKLIAAIRSGSEQEAFDILNGLFEENFGKENLISIEMGRCFMYELIATLVKAMDKVLSSDQDGLFWRQLGPIHRLTDCKSLEVLKTEMEDIFYQVCRYIKKGKKSHNEELKESILNFVDSRLTNPSLCVEDIAEHCERNPAYLARFFKEQTSVGLAYHIKKQRVELSLKRLLEDKKTIALVAEEVGFTNSNAYIRAFKEIMGMTPGQYRENRFV